MPMVLAEPEWFFPLPPLLSQPLLFQKKKEGELYIFSVPVWVNVWVLPYQNSDGAISSATKICTLIQTTETLFQTLEH